MIHPEELLAYEHEVQGLRRTVDRLRDERRELRARIHAIGDAAGLPREARIDDVAIAVGSVILGSKDASRKVREAYERRVESRERDTIVPVARKVA